MSNKKRVVILVRDNKKKSRTNRHHRKPKNHGGKTVPRNISVVDPHEHEAFHQLFSKDGITLSPEGIAKRLSFLHRSIRIFMTHPNGRFLSLQEVVNKLNKVWIDPDYEIVLQKDGEQTL